MITANRANYIKLGEKGCYEEFCFHENALALGFHDVPHQEPFNPQRAYDAYQALGCKPQVCTSYARQVAAFYEAGEETLWFTFADGKLHWCIAAPGVTLITEEDGPSRYRRTLDGWHNTDINNRPLYVHELNGNLTKAMGYQSTLFTLDESRTEYLLRRINGEELPEILRARENKKAILASIVDMMRLLNPKDFELLVELVFAQSGWQRLSANGGTQKTIDLELYLPSTHDYAFVQVKSETNQKQLEEYEAAVELRDDTYMFYVYHTAKRSLMAGQAKTRLIDAEALSEMVLNAGLFEWLLKKAR